MRVVKVPLMLAATLLLAGCPLGKKSEPSAAAETPSPKVAEVSAPADAEVDAVALAVEPTCDCAGQAADAIAVAEVPARFRGDWSGKCLKPGEYDESNMTISADTIAFTETGNIKAVVLNGDNELAIIADMPDEGKQWLTYWRFELSADGEELMDVTDDDRYFLRRRCKGVG
ncbi:hypothetical protein CO611_06240 [Lysobacteraceae bacterium NML03-0222]|nr:hypothetical protein CO611_06240 [Xanthomonadaceae bacterium NML03-0222]